MENLQKFKDLGLSDTTLVALRAKGFEEPTLIQEKTIPLLLRGDIDIIGQAQTGTGKTAAFGLPLIERLKESSPHIQALILTPTRELAIQVAEEIHSLKGKKNLQVLAVYGGQAIDQQLRRLKKGVDIVVGTPGRVIDHLNRRSLNVASIQYLILDEADEMLNMGFIDDVEEIMKSTNPEKRTLLFSATMPFRIITLAKKYMKQYELISIKQETLTTHLTDQIYFEVSNSDKFEALSRIIDIEHDFYGIIFCRTKTDVDYISSKLAERGYDAEGLHGDISQMQRERILDKFRKQRITILVATDVAARGLDINNLTHVINYSLPQDPESYVHRIGRTGRAGKEGTAITFVTSDEYRKLLVIKKVTKTDIRKESLPKISDVIETKKTRIKNDIFEIVKSQNYEEYANMADELLEENAPKDIIGAILKLAYQQELDKKNYNEIRSVSINTKGISRLFVALGRIDDMTPKKLVDFIEQETQISSRKINDVRVFEQFSFITVPFEEAEIILEIFRRKREGKKSLVERAKDKKENAR